MHKLIDEAAAVIADQFADSVIRGLEEKPICRTFLYEWEERAIKWLEAYWLAGGEAELNAWTVHYIRHGAPPWPRE